MEAIYKTDATVALRLEIWHTDLMDDARNGIEQTESPEVLTLREAADLLRISPRTASRLVRAKKIPGKKIGKEWRFHRGDLEAYLRTNP